MNVGVLFVFGCAISFQVVCAAPAVPFEVNADTSTDTAENEVVSEGADVKLKPAEPPNTSEATSTAETLTAALNDTADEAVGDRQPDAQDLVTETTTVNLSIPLSTTTPTATVASTSTSTLLTPATSTNGPTISPRDIHHTNPGLPTEAEMAIADEIFLDKMITNILRQSEQLIPTFYPPAFPEIPLIKFPSIQMPNFEIPIPSIKPTNGSTLKLIDQQTIDKGGLKGHITTYEDRRDPNVVTKMQTGHFSMNQDEVRGSGTGIFASSSASSSGGSPQVSVGTFFGGLPQFNAARPLRFA